MSLYIYPACIALYIQKSHIIVKHTPGARFITAYDQAQG